MLKKLLFYFCLFMPVSGFSYEPFLTDDASTVEKGGYQLEIFHFNISSKQESSLFLPLKNPDAPGEEFSGGGRAIAFPIGLTKGVADDVEVGIGLTYYGLPTGKFSPITNYNLGVKYRFVGDAKDGLSFAVKPTLSLPSNTYQQTSGLGMAKFGYGIYFIGEYSNSDFDFLFNILYQYQPYDINYSVGGSTDPLRTKLFQFSFAPIWKVTERLSLGLDLGLISDSALQDEQNYNQFLMGAVTYRLQNNVDLGVSYLRVLKNFTDQINTNYSSIFKLGVSYRF